MCWAGPQALSPLSPAHSSPSQARPGQGLGVGSGLAWDFRSPSRRPRPRLTAISYFSSTFRMAISTCGLRLMIKEDLKKGLKPEWDLIKLDNSVKLPRTLCTWPQCFLSITTSCNLSFAYRSAHLYQATWGSFVPNVRLSALKTTCHCDLDVYI